jgi:2-polyprenyl-3-methyl-5-hydroxy-6-metoxy-1,4-benzoquinol methylase
MSDPAERWTAAFSAARSFGGAGPGAVAWAAGRMANAPLAELDAEILRMRGRILSVGCGFGVVERYMAMRNPDIEVVGYELESTRVAAAGATQAAAPRVTVREADVTRLGDVGGFDAALAMDVFHHLEPAGQTRLAEALARLVRPGGSVLVKDIATAPRWQHLFNAAHDRLAVGELTHCRSPQEMSALLVGAGLRLEGWRRMARFSPYPHYFVRLSVPEHR